MSKFYKWLKDKNEEIYWYVIGTAMSRDSGAVVVGWVFGGTKGEGLLVMDPEVKKMKIQTPKDFHKYEMRMIRDCFESKLWNEDYWSLESIQYR